MRTPALTLPAILALLVGCNETTQLTVVEPELTVVDSLNLGSVVIGQTAESGLVLSNNGRATLELSELRIEGELFKLGTTPPSSLAPAGAVTLSISATPTVVGEFTGSVTIRSNDPNRPSHTVALRVSGRETPSCDDGNQCTADVYNAETDSCSHSFADGIPCESKDLCIQDARCDLGVCVGESKVCDDGIDCTLDVCRQSDGACVFLEKTSVCDDDNPCTADSCGATGCVHEPAANGALCDDEDSCTTGDACIAGACVGTGGEAEGTSCDDHDSCTTGDVCRADGHCAGDSIITAAQGGDQVFRFGLAPEQNETDTKFIHRRHVSMGDNGTFYGMDHVVVGDDFQHVIFAFEGCGMNRYEFSYNPAGAQYVSYVRRSLQVDEDDELRVVVGVRDLETNGWQPYTTTYLLDDEGQEIGHAKETPNGETGRALLPDGSYIYAVIRATNSGSTASTATQNLVIVREDRFHTNLWTYEVQCGAWAELLGVAGPRVVFWANGRFSALDFNTGALVWSQPTQLISKEMALSTDLNLGLVRADDQIVGVELLNGTEVFRYPQDASKQLRPIADPVIAPDGRILTVMLHRQELSPETDDSARFEWVELDEKGAVIASQFLPYIYPMSYRDARAEDFNDDSSITVAEDGIAYYGVGTQLMAIHPGGDLLWTHASTTTNAFTASVPLLRKDGVLLLNDGPRSVVGVRTNGAVISDRGWSSYRHDPRRTNYTP